MGGRRPVLIAFTVLTLLSACPAVLWLVGTPSFLRLLAVELWLSFFSSVFRLRAARRRPRLPRRAIVPARAGGRSWHADTTGNRRR
ncbi:hypothetical protein CUJ89_05250 [Burkholderia pyrrocinia]|uniref:Uncharacterized protein n=1 Tax=Burkholderia pyrrocinia TaxID=60550 RepID=A0A2Z5MS04_BURPY|nr:hypothetical protein CUJ89_05250 [Burkholderia pyrrocinia]